MYKLLSPYLNKNIIKIIIEYNIDKNNSILHQQIKYSAVLRQIKNNFIEY